MEEQHDTIFEEEHFGNGHNDLAQVNFDILELSGRWMLKVIAGPNTGAEFSMQTGSSYLIGTDATGCDIVFHDFSVSRQHARISVESDNKVFLEDMSSRNGTLVDGQKSANKQQINTSSLITMGTTTFILIDREGERETIVSPPLIAALEKASESAAHENSVHTDPNSTLVSIQKMALPPLQKQIDIVKEEEKRQAHLSNTLGALLILAAVTGLFIIVGIGTTLLFKTEEVTMTAQANPEDAIRQILKDYPSIRYSFNRSNGRLLLLGHSLTSVDRSRILDNLQTLKFISAVDASNIIIDEFVWQEANQILSKNPIWKGITIHSPQPGQFIMTGFLKTRKQAEELYDSIAQSFPYVDLLEKRVIVEEELMAQIKAKLSEQGFRNVNANLNNGELSFNGTISPGSSAHFTQLVEELKAMTGIRSVQSYVNEVARDQSMVNISDKYEVTGYSQQGGKSFSVVINGKILTKGDQLDGMSIKEIKPNTIFLEKEGLKYRIDFNH